MRVPETLMLTTDGLLRATMLLMSGSAAVAAGAWETAAGAGALIALGLAGLIRRHRSGRS